MSFNIQAKLKREQLWVLPLLLFLVLLSCERDRDPLDGIPFNERKDLEIFFEILMKHTESGFTLFGNKPISIVYYTTPEEDEFGKFEEHLVRPVLLEQGWQVWQKYADRFRSKNFALSKEVDEESALTTIIIVNKNASLNIITDNLQLFRNQFGEDFCPEQYVNNIANINKLKPLLLGILLGYGTENAFAFERLGDLCSYLANHDESDKLSKTSHDLIPILAKTNWQTPNNFQPTSGYSSFAEELNDLAARRGTFDLDGTDYGVTAFFTPVFICLENSIEKKKLMASYKTTLTQLVESYKNNTFTKVTLEKWKNG